MFRFSQRLILRSSYPKQNSTVSTILKASSTTTISNSNKFSTNQSCYNNNDNSHITTHRKFDDINGYVWKSGYESVSVPNMTLDEYVWKNVAKWENHIAIVCGVTGRKYTYSKLRDHSAAVAIRLKTKFNLKRGDIIGIMMPNIPEYAIVVMGALEAGLTITTINPIYTSYEISRQLSMCNPKMIFTLVQGVETLHQATTLAKQPSTIISAIKTSINDIIPENIINFSELMDIKSVDFSLKTPNEATPEDICILPYSSGTTGLPKGVMLTHNNLATNCEMLEVKLPNEHLHLPTTNNYQDVFPSVLPFFHIYGFTCSLISKLAMGCKIVTLPKFEPQTFINSLVDHKATYLNLVPPLVLFLANDPRITGRHLETVRTVMTGAAPLGALDAMRLQEKAKFEFIQGYGMTETSPMTFIGHKGSSNYASIGWPASTTEAKIVNVTDSNYIGLDVGESGELMVKSPCVMKGYLNNDEATSDTIVQSDNWLRTGDIAVYDSEGFFYIKDRLKELIKVKGFQVPPAELEELLRDHPKVADAGVIGIEHEKYGEVPRAFIVPKSGVDLKEQELIKYVAENVAQYKQLLGGVEFVELIPKSATGKILRRELKKIFKK